MLNEQYNVVYIKHFDNGKKYVGITNDFNRRMYDHDFLTHVNNSKYRKFNVQRAMLRHEHYTEIVFTSSDYEELKRMERIIIQNFKDLNIELYNMTSGGDGCLGFKMTDEQKAKISLSRLGEKHYKSRPMSYYENNSVTKANFKRTCNRMKWDMTNFKEIFHEYRIKPDGRREQLFYCIYEPNGSNFKWWDKNEVKKKSIFEKLIYYESHPVRLSVLKDFCNNHNIIFDNYITKFSGKYVYTKSNQREKLYYMLHK